MDIIKLLLAANKLKHVSFGACGKYIFKKNMFDTGSGSSLRFELYDLFYYQSRALLFYNLAQTGVEKKKIPKTRLGHFYVAVQGSRNRKI